MAQYGTLKEAIQAVIRTNGNNEITGAILQQCLLAMVNALGAGYQFMGVATPSTNPGESPDGNWFYLATQAGTYSYMGGIEFDGSGLGVFKYDGEWVLIVLPVPTTATLTSALAAKVDKVAGKGLSTNDLTDALKALIEGAFQQSNIVQALGDDAAKVISQKAVTEILEGYAKIDGYYATLIAGAAENLVGRGSVPAEIIRRTSGGDADLGSGSATIEKILGKSLIWNQILKNGNFASVANWQNEGATYSVASNIATITKTSASGSPGFIKQAISLISGHKYFYRGEIKSNDGSNVGIGFVDGSNANKGRVSSTQSNFTVVSNVYTADGTEVAFVLRSANSSEANSTYEAQNVFIVDLTLLGIADQISTVGDFAKLYSLPYYAYNPGQIINNKATGLKTIGFNQWDEQPELGNIAVDGTDVPANNRIRSKYIEVFPQKEYYIQIPSAYSARICFYDINKEFISAESGGIFLGARAFTTPANCAFIRFAMSESYGETYQNDICVNIAWSGYRNGEYEPYWSSLLALPITTATGKLNGEGESVTLCADGAKSAGSVYDEFVAESGYIKRFINRLGVKVLNGSTPLVNNAKTAEAFVFNLATDTSMKSLTGTLSDKAGYCASYDAHSTTLNITVYTDNRLFIVVPFGMCGTNSSQTLAEANTAFGTWLASNNITVYFQRSEPLAYVLDTPLDINYRVDDFGTEERLPADTSSAVNAPLMLMVKYAMNAVDTLRRLPVNYVSVKSLENFTTEMATKLGAFLNAAITIEATYNAETQEYDYDMDITPNE